MTHPLNSSQDEYFTDDGEDSDTADAEVLCLQCSRASMGWGNYFRAGGMSVNFGHDSAYHSALLQLVCCFLMRCVWLCCLQVGHTHAYTGRVRTAAARRDSSMGHARLIQHLMSGCLDPHTMVACEAYGTRVGHGRRGSESIVNQVQGMLSACRRSHLCCDLPETNVVASPTHDMLHAGHIKAGAGGPASLAEMFLCGSLSK